MTHPLTFSAGGVHPPQEKGLTDPRHYTILPNPQTLTLALAQHLGAPAKPVVSRRDNVEPGQLIGLKRYLYFRCFGSISTG